MSAPGRTDDEALDPVDAPHLQWASRIKAHHYHLQTIVAKGKPASTSCSPSTSDEDLQRWREAVAAPDAADRLRDYARAMHDLATRYWAAPSTAPPECAGSACEASGVVGGKRPRSPEGTAEGGGGGTGADPAAFQPRQYNDRVRSSLDCVASFYLGRPRPVEVGAPVSGSGSCAGESQQGFEARAGEATVGGYVPLYEAYPLMLSRALKPLRRQFFDEHQRMATAEEVDAMVAGMMDAEPTAQGHSIELAGPHPCPAGDRANSADIADGWGKMMHYARVVRARRHACVKSSGKTDTPPTLSATPPLPLYALDIGSCYGPFFRKSLDTPVLGEVPLWVTAMDLCPYDAEDDATARPTAAPMGVSDPDVRNMDGDVASTNCRVLRGDWITVSFFVRGAAPTRPVVTTAGGRVRLRLASTAADGARLSSAPVTSLEVYAIEVGSYDVVFFCLLLSYMPTARLRYRACLHAYLALKPGGLLVIISTRTQGPRRSRWEDQWVRCLDTIGFTNVHKGTQKKIVVLSFEKRAAPQGGGDTASVALNTQADVDAWIAAKMALPIADDGLPIIADGHM